MVEISHRNPLKFASLGHRILQKFYRGDGPTLKLKDKTVILVDDGLATGFTMLAAIKSVKKYQPAKVVVAVPVSPESSVARVEPEVDELICLYIERGAWPFAVASYYEDFHDLSDEEVINCLKLA